MIFQILLQLHNRFDLSGDSFFVESFAVFEIGKMPPDANDFDVCFTKSPELIFFQNVDVFSNALLYHRSSYLSNDLRLVAQFGGARLLTSRLARNARPTEKVNLSRYPLGQLV